MYIYQTPPIDVFDGMVEADKLIETFVKAKQCEKIFPFLEFLMGCARQVAACSGNYWEGDVRHRELHVFSVPVPDGTAYGLVWKQENNGTTFVCSPVELENFPADCALHNMLLEPA